MAVLQLFFFFFQLNTFKSAQNRSSVAFKTISCEYGAFKI